MLESWQQDECAEEWRQRRLLSSKCHDEPGWVLRRSTMVVGIGASGPQGDAMERQAPFMSATSAGRSAVRASFAALLIAIVLGAAANAAPAQTSDTSTAPPAEGPSRCGPQVESLIRQMSRAEKVGQMIMVLHAPAFGDYVDTAALIRDHHIGSVVSHGYWLGAADAVAVNNALQNAAAETRLAIPILNAADFESGVRILVPDGTSLPLPMSLGAGGRPRDAATASAITAIEARAMGFQWTFSPVSDVVTTSLNGEGGVRTFGGDPKAVADFVRAQIGAFQSNGLIATAKHFPGMGGSEVNSHFDLPRVTYDRATLERVHLRPFRAAIDAGVGAVMVGHIVVDAIDSRLPASLSRKVTTGLLRESLGFEGVIVTDSMTLGALLSRFDLGEAAVMAVNAGADIVMEIGPTEVPLIAMDAIMAALDRGEITERRVDASVRRILRLKCQSGLLGGRPIADAAAATSVVGSATNAEVGRELARRGITLVRNDGVLPFDPTSSDDTLVVGVTHEATVITTPPLSHVPALAAAVRRVGAGTVRQFAAATEDPTAAEIAEARSQAATADRIIVATYSAGALPEGQKRLVAALRETRVPIVVVAIGTPYDLAQLGSVNAYITAYAVTFLGTYVYSDVSLDVAVEVLFGADPGGRLPVPIQGGYPIGWGLTY